MELSLESLRKRKTLFKGCFHAMNLRDIRLRTIFFGNSGEKGDRKRALNSRVCIIVYFKRPGRPYRGGICVRQ